jgi:predicted phosphohydrolase
MTQEMQGTLFFLHNNFFASEGLAICGSRGWITPADPSFLPEDEPIYRREVSRLRISLEVARAAGYKRLLVMMHFPPACLEEPSNGFIDLLEEFAAEFCIFGHIHGDGAHMAPQGQLKGAACHLVACDALNFQPKKII